MMQRISELSPAVKSAMLPIERQRTAVTALAGTVLYPIFGILDWVMYPYALTQLVTIRSVVIVILVLCLVCLLRATDLLYVYAISGIAFLSAAFGISTMIWFTEGALSPYYAGLCLAMIWVAVSFTWPPRFSLWLYFLVLISYGIAVIAHPEPIEFRILLNNLFFLGFSAVGAAIGTLERYKHMVSLTTSNLEIMRSHAQLEAMAHTDPLTGLLNRRTLDEKLLELLNLNQRYGTIASVLLIDIDNFKSVNDQRNHRVGDDLLKAIADLLQVELRNTDLAYRIGGDEFFVVLPDRNQHAAEAVAERIAQSVQRICSSPELVRLHVGASIGALEIRYQAGVMDTPEAVCESADAAMYLKKRTKPSRIRSTLRDLPSTHQQEAERQQQPGLRT